MSQGSESEVGAWIMSAGVCEGEAGTEGAPRRTDGRMKSKKGISR